MDHTKIKELADKQKLSIKQLCKQIDITDVGLAKMIKNNSLKVTILEKIANVLQVPVSYFFDDSLSTDPATLKKTEKTESPAALLKENEVLKAQNELLREMVDLLKRSKNLE